MGILHQEKRRKRHDRPWAKVLTLSLESHAPVDAIDDLTAEFSLTGLQS
jgi:hypothetical protein